MSIYNNYGIFIAILLGGSLLWNVLATSIVQAQLPPFKIVQDQQEEWILQKGDWLLFNTEKNTLQFVRENYLAMSKRIKIGSGINTDKKMTYLDMRYNPRTPERTWELRSAHQFKWYRIYGTPESKEQLFLRLYEIDGEKREYTHYGIHTTPYIDDFLTREDGFNSWGCLVTDYQILKKIEELFYLNEEVVKVVTSRTESQQLIALLKSM